MQSKPPVDTFVDPAPVIAPRSADPNVERENRRAERDAHRNAPAQHPGVMIPSRRKRIPLEAPLMRMVATGGIVGIAVVIGAIMASQDAAGWITGLVVGLVSVVLAAVLWSSRQL
jgi:hypothetical protein